MKKVKLLLLALALVCVGRINAQTANLRIDSNALAGLDTLFIGQVDTFSITIFNDDSAYFLGKITINGVVNFIPFSGDSVQSPVYYSSYNLSDSVPAHGSVSRLLTVTATNPPFIVGTSGVVIWPKVTAQTYPHVPATISDSVSKLVTVLYPAGINEITERDLKVYMSGQQLIIQDGGKYLLKKAELFDVGGRLLEEQLIATSGIIDMNQYASGVYFTRVTFNDNTSVVVKVLNAR